MATPNISVPDKLPCAWRFPRDGSKHGESGALEAWKTAGGHRRIPVASVDALLARRRNLTPSAQDNGGQLDILIAEDDQTLQMLYQMTIDSWGMPIKLRIVANGFDGLLQVGPALFPTSSSPT